MLYQRKQSLEAANEHSVFLFGARHLGLRGKRKHGERVFLNS